MQKFITQQMYNFIGNGRHNQKTDVLLTGIIDQEQEELLNQLMEVDKNGFETGINCIYSFLSGKNMF